MAKNDVVLLDGIIDDRVAAAYPSSERDEVFEYLVLQEILKDYDPSADEIDCGWTDGRDDGGIDGFYVLVNGIILDDANSFSWPRSNASLDVYIVSCKHHDTFRQAPLDSMQATLHELLDLAIDADKLTGKYSEELIEVRDLLIAAYRRLSIGRPVVKFHMIYGSRGDASDIGESVVARAAQIKGTVEHLFSSCEATFRFVGASELVESHRRSKTFTLNLPFIEYLATGKESYVLLVPLDKYWRFVSDEDGSLRRYLFDSNVRDYLGTNQVNDDIARSLLDPGAPDFWWLNNGVTILATNAAIHGKTIQLQNIQIVNGLQTTETIFQHFSVGHSVSSDRALLVKIIVSSDAQARDRIIRATNNQSPVEIAALHATDKIQRDIEDILARHSWYYERRRNYYRNIGKPPARFVTPVYVASAAITLILKNPAVASGLRSRFMRNQEGYETVFSDKFPVELWPILVDIYKRVDSSLLKISSRRTVAERFIGNWRSLVSFIVVSRLLGEFSYSTQKLLSMDTTLITDEFVKETWDFIMQAAGPSNSKKRKPKDAAVRSVCTSAADKYQLSGVEQVGRRTLPNRLPSIAKQDLVPLPPGQVAARSTLENRNSF
jgi:hypothetical protein